MAITSTIIFDTLSGTAILNVLLDGVTVVDNITYTNSTQELSFSDRGDFYLEINDLILFLNLIVTFNYAILGSVFAPNQHQYVIDNMIRTTYNPAGVGALQWTNEYTSISLYDLTCDAPNGSIYFNKRNDPVIFSYASWLYLAYELSNYKNVIAQMYGK